MFAMSHAKVLFLSNARGRHILALVTALIAAPSIAQEASLIHKKPDIVWTWSQHCKAKQQLGVTVRLRSEVLYRGLMPICRNNRDLEEGRAKFRFSSSHLFGGYRARKTDTIEGDIWQASGETDALILGISFSTKRQVMLNTLHIADPVKKTSSELDNGLYITTYPVILR